MIVAKINGFREETIKSFEKMISGYVPIDFSQFFPGSL